LASFLILFIKILVFMATITKETFKIQGEKLLNKVKELVKEGNVRKISIHEKDGRELMSFPLSLGVVGAVFAPVLAAVGALAALIGECSITVEREEDKP
jgi:hypothetical protein